MDSGDEIRKLAEETTSVVAREALSDAAVALSYRQPWINVPYHGKCPRCGNYVTMVARYCKSCGQALPLRWE